MTGVLEMLSGLCYGYFCIGITISAANRPSGGCYVIPNHKRPPLGNGRDGRGAWSAASIQ